MTPVPLAFVISTVNASRHIDELVPQADSAAYFTADAQVGLAAPKCVAARSSLGTGRTGGQLILQLQAVVART